MKKKDVFVQFRATGEVKQLIIEAAKAQGLCMSDFLRDLIAHSKECANLAS